MKKLFPIYISVVLFVSCIDLYTNQDDNDEKVFQSYEMSSFTSKNLNGVYLIDPRPVFKNMIYYFDLSSKQWSALASRTQLPVSDPYEIFDFLSPHIVKNNRLIMYKTNKDHLFYNKQGFMYEYDLATNRLSSVEIQFPNIFGINLHDPYDSSFNISQIVYNQFSDQCYYVADSVLYLLNGDYEFTKKCTVPLGNHAIFLPRFDFISSDTLVTLVSEYRETDSYPEQDPWSIQNKNLVIHKTNINTGKDIIFRHNFLDSLNTRFFYLENLSEGTMILLDSPDPYYLDLNTVKLIRINFRTNEYEHLPRFDNSVNIAENPNNITNWGDILYHQFNSINCFQKDGSIYLFNNENGFVLYPGESSWQRLPDLDFIALNPKQ